MDHDPISADPAGDLVRLVPAVDRLDLAEGTLLLYERQLVSLSALGATIVDLAPEPIHPEALTRALIDEFGEPASGRASDATRGVLDELVGLGVLEWLPENPPR